MKFPIAKAVEQHFKIDIQHDPEVKIRGVCERTALMDIANPAAALSSARATFPSLRFGWATRPHVDMR